MISPMLFLAVLLAGTIAMFLIQLAADRIHHRRLVSLAREWRMHYAPDDRFNLAPRVAERLSLPGAADVRVVDLIYGSQQGRRRYVFSAYYTKGVVRWKRRAKCIASLSESHDGWSALKVAPGDLSIVEQYRSAGDIAETASS